MNQMYGINAPVSRRGQAPIRFPQRNNCEQQSVAQPAYSPVRQPAAAQLHTPVQQPATPVQQQFAQPVVPPVQQPATPVQQQFAQPVVPPVQQPILQPVQQSCSQVAYGTADVNVPIRIFPTASVGEMTAECSGAPNVFCQRGGDGVSCRVIVSQTISLRIPVTFGITASEEESFMNCGFDPCGCDGCGCGCDQCGCNQNGCGCNQCGCDQCGCNQCGCNQNGCGCDQNDCQNGCNCNG